MNILYLATHLNTGGITSYLYTLARGLKERGHALWIASSGGEYVPRFERAGITCISIPIRTKSEIDPRMLACALKLKGIIRRQGIAILHAHTRVTQVLACFLQGITGAPALSTCHGFFKARFNRRWFPCWGVKTIAVSEEVRQHLIDDFKLSASDIRVIPNGIDVDGFTPASREEKKRAQAGFGLAGGPVIGIIARLSDVKGHTYLIKAMEMVVRRNPAAQLLIVGKGREEKRLRSETAQLRIEAHVHFVAEVADTRDALAAMDIFVMPSLQEGLGLSLMEAMASGLAVVGSSVGGIQSLIRSGHNGLLVPPQDPSSLADAIAGLIHDTPKALRYGERAREFVRQNFSQDVMVTSTEEVYQQCLKGQG
jgi:glycosyltransferase involved in cell wall biosynthesis